METFLQVNISRSIHENILHFFEFFSHPIFKVNTTSPFAVLSKKGKKSENWYSLSGDLIQITFLHACPVRKKFKKMEDILMDAPCKFLSLFLQMFTCRNVSTTADHHHHHHTAHHSSLLWCLLLKVWHVSLLQLDVYQLKQAHMPKFYSRNISTR